MDPTYVRNINNPISLDAEQELTRNIVFAPALPSYDLFKNFEHRGESFEKMIKTMNGFVYSN
jgi:UDP-N-acetylmuramoylalanine-D-glutamate ligase